MKTLEQAVAAAAATGYAASEILPFAVREYAAARPSRGRSDSVGAGCASRISGVIGIVASDAVKRCIGDSGWQLCWTVRPPADEAERDVCRRAMLIRWSGRMAGVAYAGGPDDERGRAEWEERQRELATTLDEVQKILA